MADRLQQLEEQVARLVADLEDVRGRLAALEKAPESERREPGSAAAKSAPASRERISRVAEEAEQEPSSPLAGVSLATVMGALGRTCLVLAGAFLLRALTDAGTLPRGLGVMAGLTYAAVWLVFADRARGEAAQLGASFHGVTSCVIAYPLLWEATAGFGVLSPAAGAAGIVVFTALCFTVAWRSKLQLLGWAAILSAIVSGVGLSFATHAMTELSVALLLVGVGSLWLGEARGWPILRWPAALASDFLIISLLMVVTREEGIPPAYQHLGSVAALTLPLALLIAYLGCFAVKALVRRGTLGIFESVQGIAALVVGLLAVLRAAPVAGLPLAAAGGASLLIAAGFYGAAFAVIERAQGRGINYAYFGVVGVVLTLFGSALLTSGVILGAAWGLLAVAAAFFSWRFDRFTLRAHGAAYALAAAVATGVLAGVYHALFSGAEQPWRPLSFEALLVVGAAAGSYLLMVAARKGELRWFERLPGLIAVLVTVAGAAAIVVGMLVAVLRHGSKMDPSLLAAARTGVLALAAIVLALLGRGERLRELGWLVYPILVVGGFKMIGEDLRHGSAATLTAGFVMYGAALILGPRLLRQREGTTTRPIEARSSRDRSDGSGDDEPEDEDQAA